MRTWTERQRVAAEQWIEDSPSFTHYHLMQIACQVTRVAMQDPGKLKPEDFRLAFAKPEPPKTDEQLMEQAMIEKAIWMGWAANQPKG